MKKFFALTALTLLLTAAFSIFIPLNVSAAETTPDNIGELFSMAICMLTKYVVPFLFALALVMFLAGVVKYVKGGDNEETREAGRGLMLFGIIALFVMVGVWGFVEILYNSFFGGQEFSMPSLPKQSEPFQ
jgi:hypothetical protein